MVSIFLAIRVLANFSDSVDTLQERFTMRNWQISYTLVVINTFNATGLFLWPLKTSENPWFFMFSGGMKRDQWHEMG